ncbi:hypothetical protein COV23_00425 [Candidatus Wolfebacteria bacterium CG10_big_fil_rev_8_21_14_0_10_31_9]|uniref:Uncharacterized protein n=1 Tax=Candidatus Wolfebacteria bacterium CG10_big_fil_rev_8_21_14_0_10_31_9 TaxID=1975070 RepID=A0A2H0RCM7_9BACT|nr:MAG: hypothetical protein COV23_00425 [Candidatus Wolfebacteria bacterium CG10_big_fil_rev_8_21_14_0_10_31_9]
MEDKNNQQTQCCFSNWHNGGKHRLLRWVLMIVILGIVFSFGVKLGEFKTYIKGGYYNERGDRNYSGKNFYGPGMMRGSYGNYPDSTTTPW